MSYAHRSRGVVPEQVTIDVIVGPNLASRSVRRYSSPAHRTGILDFPFHRPCVQSLRAVQRLPRTMSPGDDSYVLRFEVSL